MGLPKVSIILTSYNHADFIAESIESVLAQDFTDYELYIFDDHSTDGSWEIIQDYAARDTRIHPYRHARNEGRALPLGFEKNFRGQYTAMAHCDDKWRPGKLAKQVAFLDENPKYVACFTEVQLIDDMGSPYENPEHFFTKAFGQKNRSRHQWLNYMFYSGCPFCHPSVLARTEKYLQPGAFPYPMGAVTDYYTWILLALTDEIYVYPEKLACFRVRSHEANTSGESFEKRNRQSYELWRTLHLYTRIDTQEDLLAVFPQTSKYLVEGGMVVPYALARVFIDDGPTPMHRQLGLDILFELLQTQYQLLREQYGYTKKEYARETGVQDLYGLVKPERFQTSWLYFDFGEGFSDENTLVARNYITEAGNFYLQFDLRKVLAGRNVKALRFDPDKERFRRYKLFSVQVNGKAVYAKPVGSVQQGEWDVFYTIFAAYELELGETDPLIVTVEGQTEPLSLFDVDMHFIAEKDVRAREADKLREIVAQRDERCRQTEEQLAGVKQMYNEACAREEALRQSHAAFTGYVQAHRVKGAANVLLGRPLPGSKLPM